MMYAYAMNHCFLMYSNIPMKQINILNYSNPGLRLEKWKNSGKKRHFHTKFNKWFQALDIYRVFQIKSAPLPTPLLLMLRCWLNGQTSSICSGLLDAKKKIDSRVVIMFHKMIFFFNGTPYIFSFISIRNNILNNKAQSPFFLKWKMSDLF